MKWDGYGVYQRTDSDCGIAAVATLVGMSYEAVEDAWRKSINAPPGASSYKDLLVTLDCLGISSKRATKSNWGIRRARARKRDRHSHWIVTYSCGGVWCPALGFFKSIDIYGMPNLGHGIVLI